MTNFISVEYCLLYLLSLYTIGNYCQLSTRNPEQFKTTNSNINDLYTTEEPVINMNDRFEFIPKIKEEYIEVMANDKNYLRNFKKRLVRFEEKLKNTREELGGIRSEYFKQRGEETLNSLEDQLVIARNYLRLVKEGESADRLEVYLIDMVESLEKLERRLMDIRHIERAVY